MKTLATFLVITITLQMGIAQDAIYNHGTLRMHDDVQIGFHEDFVNDGNFENGAGLAGFYGYEKSLTISGNSIPTFYDTEVAVDRGVFLYNSINILNNNNWITGNLVTPKSKKDIYVNFVKDAFYIGEGDFSLVDGFSAITNKDNFVFPVGDDERLRTLTINSTLINSFAKCAYFFESPNTPSNFGESFNTDKKESDFLSVSRKEFWSLEGEVPATVTLTWDQNSNLENLVRYIEDIKIVGWEKEKKMWVNLGNTHVEGEITEGFVTSNTFIPNEYEIITFGGNDTRLNEFVTLELDNYFVSPNGDGKNDYLVLEGIENSPNNEIQIFDRYGKMVYSKLHYKNEFNGISNRNIVINRGSGLPSGVYFYIITLLDLRQRHQGYLYLTSSD